jgi:hypothetical protein
VTAVPGVPRIDVLGLYPTAETLLAQGILLALLIYAAVVILRQRAVAARLITGETDAMLVAVRGLPREFSTCSEIAEHHPCAREE